VSAKFHANSSAGAGAAAKTDIVSPLPTTTDRIIANASNKEIFPFILSLILSSIPPPFRRL
jgi:hypothetical protein